MSYEFYKNKGALWRVSVDEPSLTTISKGAIKSYVCRCSNHSLINYLLSEPTLFSTRFVTACWDTSLCLTIRQLLGFAVARGGLVTVAQFLTLALYVAQPTKLNWFVFFFPLRIRLIEFAERMPVHFMLGKLCHITMSESLVCAMIHPSHIPPQSPCKSLYFLRETTSNHII